MTPAPHFDRDVNMYNSPTTAADVDHLQGYLSSWRRSLRAANKAPRTIDTYMLAAEQLCDFLDERGMPTEASAVTREHVEAFLANMLETRPAATAAQRYASLRQLFRWLQEAGEIRTSPMARMHHPKVPETPVPLRQVDEVRRLLEVCKGADFESRRDTAIVRLFYNTGMRLSELAGLRVVDIDADLDVAVVLGKGRRARGCPLPTTVRAVGPLQEH